MIQNLSRPTPLYLITLGNIGNAASFEKESTFEWPEAIDFVITNSDFDDWQKRKSSKFSYSYWPFEKRKKQQQRH